MASHPRVAPPGARLPVTRLADLPAKPLGVMLPDRHLPDLLSPDPLTWEWPYACHRHGHVWEVGSDRCTQCRAPWAEFGEEVATAVTRSDGHVVLVAIPPGIAP